MNYGFTSILADPNEKPQCVLCFKVLGNDSMRPSKLKHHLTTIHPQYAERDPDFFKRHERNIFEQLNRLNLKLQGKERNVFHHIDCIRAFLDKLQNWQRKVSAGNFAMFENISIVLDEIEEDHLLDPSLKNFIIQHLKSLESELKRYFPKFEKERKLVRNPFSGTLDIAVIPDDGQHEFLDLRNESAVRDLYEEKYLTVFWCSMYQSYPKVSEIALRVILSFSTTYLCESGFSILLQLKNKIRNRLHVDPDMRGALSVTQPRINRLTERKQCHPSH
ncbi:Zinc finger BED domain-containing protein 5-like 8, partial [Homarus americanus]